VATSETFQSSIAVWVRVDRILFCDHNEHAKLVFSEPCNADNTSQIPCPLKKSSKSPLRSWLLLLLLPQRRQTNTRDLDDLESNTRNITLRLSLTTETSKEDLVVLVYEVETTVIGDCIDPSLAIVQFNPFISISDYYPSIHMIRKMAQTYRMQ
jgi:hypothetical protein